MWRGVTLSLILMPLAAAANVLTFVISPDSNPNHGLACRVEVLRGQVIAVEAQGHGRPPRHALRWPAGKVERAAMLRGLAALASGDLPSVDRYASRVPTPPYVTVMWSTRVDDVAVSGLYIQTGLTLPASLWGVLAAVLPGSECLAAVS